MTRDEIKAMDFEAFKKAVPSLEGVGIVEADGTEIYGLYKHNVCYVERDGVERTLQMIVPEFAPNVDKDKTFPAVLYVQGSAWMKQDEYKRLAVMARLAARGFVTAILQYRESSIAAFPAPVEDAKTGVRFLRKFAADYHINPDQIFLMGDSSGGNTAVNAAFTADMPCMDTDVYGEYSCKVKAVIDFYGVTDVMQKGDFPTTPNQGEPDSPEGKEIGNKNVYEYPELAKAIECAEYVKEGTEIPPIFMIHGTGDTIVSYNQSLRLYKKLLEEGKEVEFHLLKNAEHGDVAFWTDKILDMVEDFIRRHMD